MKAPRSLDAITRFAVPLGAAAGIFCMITLAQAATVIGTSIQTGGTLSVTSSSTLSGPVTFNGAATFTNTAPVTIYGTADQTRSICFYSCATDAEEIHTINVASLGLYSHSNNAVKSPYLNLYRSKGTQAIPAALTYSGVYEADPLAGINMNGYDGANYITGPSILGNPDENWTTSRHGSHLSIYFTAVGHNLNQQLVQFGGRDALGTDGGFNTIFAGPIVSSGNQSYNPGIFGSSSPAAWHFRSADDSADIAITSLTTKVAPGTFAAAGTCNAAAEGTTAAVTDSSTTTWGATITGGSTNHVLAYCDGTNWTVMGK